jgi:hypothetical protein
MLINGKKYPAKERSLVLTTLLFLMTLISLLYVVGNAYIHAQVALKTARRAASESCMFTESSGGVGCRNW